MKYIDECSYQEIERLTGFSANEVKSHLQNARRNFINRWRETVTKETAWRRTT
jgi:DNA-directed RNA polymerase specialized sigma24 family protein